MRIYVYIHAYDLIYFSIIKIIIIIHTTRCALIL